MKTIGEEAFEACYGMTNAVIDGIGLTIPSRLFRDCSRLECVTFGDGITNITGDSQGGLLTHVFGNCNSLKRISFGTGLTVLAQGALCNLPALETLEIPAVTTIYSNAMASCTNLRSCVLNEHIDVIGDDAFNGCSQVQLGTISGELSLANTSTIGKSAFANCKAIQKLQIGGKLKTLGTYAFKGCTGLKTAFIDGIDLYLSEGIFQNCTNFESVAFGDGITGMAGGSYKVFKDCNKLKSISFGNGLKALPVDALAGTSALQPLEIPAVTNFGENAVGSCTNLISCFLNEHVNRIGKRAFDKCSRAQFGSNGMLSLPNVTSVGEHAFWNCNGIRDLRIGPKLEAISAYAFEYCYGMTNATIGSSVMSIGGEAFANTTSLTDVWFEGAPPSVEETSVYYAPFYKVAEGARGHYTSAYRAEWKGVIGTDGKWQGLIMEEIPAPMLRVESANPVEGSLTLAWDEVAPLDGVTYSVYRGAGESRSAAELMESGLTGTTWTDNDYWSAEPVLSPLNYWIVAKGGGYDERESNRVETRHRYGVFIGLSDFAWYNRSSRLPELAKDAAKLRELFVGYGGMDSDNAVLLQDSKATFEGVSNAIAKKAKVVLPGDMFVLYIATHGGYKNGYARVSLYDSLPIYEKGGFLMTELFEMLNDFNPYAVVIPIIMACHSGAFVGYAGGTVTNVASEGFKQFVNAGLAMCRANMPVMASCGAVENSQVFHFQDYSDFGGGVFPLRMGTRLCRR